MKLLFDQNLSHRLVEQLSDLFPGSTQARLIGLDQAPDHEVWRYAQRHGYTIVSRDVDLAEMAALHGAPPFVIWLRGGNSSTQAVEASLRLWHMKIIAASEEGQAACIEILR